MRRWRGYRMRDPDHAEYPNADFRAAMLKDTKPYMRAGIGLSGGGSAVRCNAHFGYAGGRHLSAGRRVRL